jgi:hypothetical protein
MNTPYLIQRAKFQNRDRSGIDGLLRFDYMGCAEFEWNALPESLGRIREVIASYGQFDYSFENEKTITVFCKKEDLEKMPKILENLYENKYRLKEFCDLDFYVDGNQNHNDFWWDIKNDFMLWKKDDEFTTKFIKALETK